MSGNGHDTLTADDITWTGMAPTSTRVSLEPWIEASGIRALDATSTSEQIELALVRLREGLPNDLDDISRARLRDDVLQLLRDRQVRHTAKLVDAALARSRTPKPPEAKRTKPPPSQGRELLFEMPEPWPDPVDGAALLTNLAATFERFCALPAHASTALALWALHTYTFGSAFISPILAITSPTKRCGKTVLLIVLGSIVTRRLFASNVTSSVLFRAIEKYSPSLLIDEADTFVAESEELRGILNSGHTRKTASVIRAVGDDHEPRVFSTWCPKAIAAIGRLPGTLEDRAIQIKMRRRLAGDRVERLRQDRIDEICLPVRRQAVRWAAGHIDVLGDADPLVPVVLNDRAADCWRPLLAIADLAGGEWPDRARQAAEVLSGTDDDPDISVELLRDIQEILRERDEDFIHSEELVKALVALVDRPWATWRKEDKPLTPRGLAKLLDPLGIHPDQRRPAGGKPVRGYRRAGFDDQIARYLPAQAVQRDATNVSGPEPADPKCDNQGDCHTCASVTEARFTESRHAVPLGSAEGAADDEFRG